jgi:hypothetical protein
MGTKEGEGCVMANSARGHRFSALLIVLAAMVVATVMVIVVALDTGTARAATPTRATIEATSFTVDYLQTGEAFAVCPGTKRALGGGVVQVGSAVGPAGHLFVIASGPLDATGFTSETRDGDVAKQWYAAVSNDSGTPRTFKVFAICSNASNATVEATEFTVGHIQTGEAFAVCPGTKRALGGGVVQSGPPVDIGVMASGPLDATGLTIETNDFDKAKQWYAAVSSGFHESGTQIFKTFAICE